MKIHLFLALLSLSLTPPQKDSVIGIDHIPVVVNNLDSAANFYKKIGFIIKPGRFHQNGIRNQHIKFPNGTEIELITASQPVDPLTTEYCNSLKQGEGPVYFGLFATNPTVLTQQIDTNNLHPLFFGSRNHSPTDKPEHFAHTNTAYSLTSVWLATDHIPTYVQLFKKLGIQVKQKKMFSGITAQIAKLKEGEVILLPASLQVIPNHQVIGATVQVTDLKKLKTILQQSGIKGSESTNSILLSPALTHGIYLEFRQ
ncbi:MULTISPECIES: VOC family protein [unclassified Chitinophaga]|uniref:VOC family protein n=1 Tax=unclassified Chitinophaga TaxID=2619133 RepID=UPI0009CD38D5|nr:MULTISPECIES: VOC family protein [unclassified Chitinophaga]OMP77402.1 hypothetical protein BW716_20250 [[Flexibacter] sp. ATCC 35208]WPV67145.1 VOC family protein [Chitinophaga sp. LS1]